MAATATVGFYIAGPRIPGIGDFIQRYFCSHPLEYISTAMFFTGMATLFGKYASLRAEKRILQDVRLAAVQQLNALDNSSDREQALAEWCEQQPKIAAETKLFRRVEDTLNYLKGSRRDGLEEHLRYLAELASDRLYQSFATIRTITWAIPILGFLGTVIGITMAIANVTPEQLDSSLGEVTGGLAVAFDTTALALGMSIVLVFASFLAERSEQQVLSDVEQFGIETLLPWFGADKRHSSTLDHSEGRADSLIQYQAEIWQSQLAAVRATWTDVLQHHAGDLREAVDTELQQTLASHRETAVDARDAYTAALQQSTQAVTDHIERMLVTFEDRMSAWQQAILTSSQESTRQSEALHSLGATMLRLTESEERLTALQKQLNDNLQALQVANTMEQTANSLAAAVHLLTVKTAQRSAA